MELVNFEFPISDQERANALKKIFPSTLPNFYGLIVEDPNIFLLEFDVLCHRYDYKIDAYRLKIFPTTVKDAALRLFMGLGINVITSLDIMKKIFL